MAYELSWLIRRKPLQIIKNEREDLVYVNERFILSYIVSYLTEIVGSDFYESLNKSNQKAIDGYFNSLYYYFKYRDCKPQVLELVLLSFSAGMAATNYNQSKKNSNYFSFDDNDVS